MTNLVKRMLDQKSMNINNNKDFIIDFFDKIEINKNKTKNEVENEFGKDISDSIRAIYLRLFLDGFLDRDFELRNNARMNWI
jgi:hypothetical protein